MRDVADPPDTGTGTGRLYAPMLEAAWGVRLALFRDRHGTACAVGFTSVERLERVLGSGYTVWPLGRSVVRELAAARGVGRILVDPVLAAARVAEDDQASIAHRVDPQVAGALAVCAAAGAAAMFLGELR